MSTYLSHASVVRTRRFRCASCGHRAKAVVTGVGEGTASSLNVTGGGPEATAKRRAEENAERDVDHCLAAVACPKCGKRDAAAMRAAWSRVLVPVVLTCAAIALLGWAPMIFDMNMRESDKPIAGWITSGIGVFVGGIVLLFHSPSTRQIDARVKFETETYRDGIVHDEA